MRAGARVRRLQRACAAAAAAEAMAPNRSEFPKRRRRRRLRRGLSSGHWPVPVLDSPQVLPQVRVPRLPATVNHVRAQPTNPRPAPGLKKQGGRGVARGGGTSYAILAGTRQPRPTAGARRLAHEPTWTAQNPVAGSAPRGPELPCEEGRGERVSDTVTCVGQPPCSPVRKHPGTA